MNDRKKNRVHLMRGGKRGEEEEGWGREGCCGGWKKREEWGKGEKVGNNDRCKE